MGAGKAGQEAVAVARTSVEETRGVSFCRSVGSRDDRISCATNVSCERRSQGRLRVLN